jgi:ABC-2 type transport system permease protein
MKLLRDTWLFTGRHTLQNLRNPVWMFVGFSTPLLYLALFTPLLKGAGVGHENTLDLFLPGILSLLAFASGASAGFGTIFELQAGVIERFRVTPTSRLAILLGPLISGMTLMFAFDAVLVAVGAAFGYHVHWAGLFVLGVLLGIFSLTLAAFSTALALVTKDISSFAAVINGINLPVLLLAGVLLPISFGPEWMRVLAHFNPLYYLVVAARSLSHGTFSGGPVWQAFAVLVPLCALALAWATRVYRRAVSSRRLPRAGGAAQPVSSRSLPRRTSWSWSSC